MDKLKKKQRLALSTRCGLFIACLYLLAAAAAVAGFLGALRGGRAFHSAGALPFGLLFLALCALPPLAYRLLLRPYHEIRRVLRQFLQGRSTEALFAMPDALVPELPGALSRLGDALDKQAHLKNAMKQAEYLALQNQINPHFLYNTLEAIRGDALLSGMDTIADVTEALAIYFRYTISKVDQLVTLGDELRNVESYFAIQQYRYGDRVRMSIEYEEADAGLLACYMPKLTLQPIVENAVTHGLEPKVGEGHIRIHFEGTQSRLLLSIRDDGVGMSAESLESLLARLRIAAPDYAREERARGGGIALINVNNRLRLLFGEQYGLTITSAPGLGAQVCITLPRQTDAPARALSP